MEISLDVSLMHEGKLQRYGVGPQPVAEVCLSFVYILVDFCKRRGMTLAQIDCVLERLWLELADLDVGEVPSFDGRGDA